MKNLKINYKIVLIILGLTLINCKNKKFDDLGSYDIIFPSEVKYNDKQFGKIKIDFPFDTISLNQKDRRYTFLYLGVFRRQKKMSLVELKKQQLDTFVMLNENIIPFEIYFNKKGKLKLDGYISDQVILDSFYPNGDSRIITHEVRIIKDIEVIE